MSRIGVDVVSLGRVRSSLARHADAFIAKLLTPAEAEYCAGARMVERIGGRIAAKEAVMKVIGQGWPALGWTDIEVLPGESGRPEVKLTGRAKGFADAEGLQRLDISITHDGDLAIAVAFGSLRGT
jgi:phosphopantetheine--protein transferase-like protein